MPRPRPLPPPPPPRPPDLAGEEAGINTWAEYGLHDALKRLAAGPDGRIEVPLDGRIADAVRADGELVEVQTAHLDAIPGKVAGWLAGGRRVRVQVPLAVATTIVRLDATGTPLSRRRSPKKRTFWDLFPELVRASALLRTPGLVVEVLFVEVTEHRRVEPVPVRRGRFLRSFTTVDRTLEAIRSHVAFASPADWRAVLPPPPPEGWSSASLAVALGIPPARARQVLYTFARAGLVAPVASPGRHKHYLPEPPWT